ncbi:hypothetical protein GY21_08510 [Cryobacterium roopkundense]|uniref:Uncharacterized protein n=1 Tax=Cryobacterium roopkundense TaxID=1001240 RepID=A0A099JFZ4_9MICO|nr:hypothetical protein GY21_08510 [Cryobacterium roopkundense]MBB5640503.1 hypothetical protein [Cryobacterium roopkundense]
MTTELNAAIEERLREINHGIRRADDTTRRERFDSKERELLGALPDGGFDDVRWKELKAALYARAEAVAGLVAGGRFPCYQPPISLL